MQPPKLRFLDSIWNQQQYGFLVITVFWLLSRFLNLLNLLQVAIAAVNYFPITFLVLFRVPYLKLVAKMPFVLGEDRVVRRLTVSASPRHEICKIDWAR